MAALVLDHPAQHLVQHRMRGAADELVVAGQRGQLVDRAPGHVDGHEVAREHRAEHRGEEGELVADAEPLAELLRARGPRGHGRGAVRQLRLGRHLHAVGAQEVREGLAVPELLVHPAGEERRDLRVVRRAGSEQVTQIDDRVGLDVHHVVHAHHVAVGKRMARDVVPVEFAQIQAFRRAQVAVEVEFDDALLGSSSVLAHVPSYGPGARSVHCRTMAELAARGYACRVNRSVVKGSR